MDHYDYRMVSAIVWSAAYALATLGMELFMADKEHGRGHEEAASKHVASAVDLHRAIQERRDYYDRKGED